MVTLRLFVAHIKLTDVTSVSVFVFCCFLCYSVKGAAYFLHKVCAYLMVPKLYIVGNVVNKGLRGEEQNKFNKKLPPMG